MARGGSVLFLRCLVFTILLAPQSLFAAPKVAVSVVPVHSLVSMVMQDVAQPSLLITGGQSAHTSYLTPSSVRKLAEADLLVWVGPELETALGRQVSKLQNLSGQLSLLHEPSIKRLRNRAPGHHADHRSETLSGLDHHDESNFQIDPHIWLSTRNAMMIVKAIDKTLGQLDPENAAIYSRNADQAIDKIASIKSELAASFASQPLEPFLVYHDAFQYFEHEFELDGIGALTLNPEHAPGARTLLSIRKMITDLRIKCIFHEPQFQPKILTRIAEEFEIELGVLDPLGLEFNTGPAQWFELMLAIQDRIQRCNE